MAEAALWVLLAGVAFVAATLAAVTGFGGAAVLLPVLVQTFWVRNMLSTLPGALSDIDLVFSEVWADDLPANG